MRKISSFLASGIAAGALIASPALAQDNPPPLNPADTAENATQGIGAGARPVGADWSRSPVAAPSVEGGRVTGVENG